MLSLICATIKKVINIQYNEKIELMEFIDNEEIQLRAKLQKGFEKWNNNEISTIKLMIYIRDLLEQYINEIEQY